MCTSRFRVSTRTQILFPALLLAAAFSAAAQDGSSMTGTVVSSSRNTLVVRSDAGQYQLFVFERGATRPATLSAGNSVRITSTPGDDPGVRIASDVTVVEAEASQGSANRGAASGASASSTAVPREV